MRVRKAIEQDKISDARSFPSLPHRSDFYVLKISRAAMDVAASLDQVFQLTDKDSKPNYSQALQCDHPLQRGT